MTQSESNARKIFEQAIDITEVHQRNEFIQSACIGDSELLTQVEALLLAHQNAAGILETSAKNESQPASSSSAETSDGKSQDYQLKSTRDSIRDYRQSEVIGPYKLLQEIGSGGMGQVWMAEQQKPVRRRVAVKLIKAGMDTKLVIARFEAERQALALMDHPHIAKVFDAGTTDDGRPFFVMEYVRGKSITQFADDNHLSIPERLELFEQVCNAIQHAHHKGIIHRDLKPNNVLVSAPDGKPISKVIDFGIAKATSHQLTDLTLYTMHDQFIGTPQYMSPEQAAGSVDIDTRTDVYSLGVILFELLTGSTPFPKEELQAAGLEKIKAIIMEKEPPKPSTHISLSEQTIDSLAASRKVEPKGLGVLVRGELDWIVMKALDKERTRRYATPNNFAEDILAYLKGEPIDAAPPSRIYRLQKFIRMNRGQVLIGSMVLLLLILGLGGTTWGLLRTQRQRVERQETIAEDQQAIAQRHLTQGILRPIGFGKSDNRLNASELTSFHDWSQLSDSKLKVQVLRQAFENPESALRLARRGERSLQACIGTSLTRHAAVLDHLNQLQTDTTVDLRISFAACWLAAHLGDADLPGLESVIDRVLNQTPTSREAISANDLAMFGDAWVKGATDANQIDRTFNLLLLIADKTEDDDVLRNVGANVCDLVIRLKDNQILQAWDLMIDVAETYDNFFDGEIASAGFRNLALHMEQPQIQRAWDSLLGRVVTKEVGSLRYDIEPFIVGLAALASRLEGQQIDAALNSMADVVRGTDNWLGLSVTAASIEAMLPMLERKRTEIALDSLIEIVNKSGKRENLESANRVLRELATGLEGQQLEEAWGSLIKIAKRRSGFYFFNYKIDVDFESFAGRLNSEQIGRALVELIEIFENTNDEENLEVSVEALSALASHLDSDQAEPALDNLINRFANIEDQDVLKFAGKAMAILATRLDSQPASDAWDSILGGVRRADSANSRG